MPDTSWNQDFIDVPAFLLEQLGQYFDPTFEVVRLSNALGQELFLG